MNISEDELAANNMKNIALIVSVVLFFLRQVGAEVVRKFLPRSNNILSHFFFVCFYFRLLSCEVGVFDSTTASLSSKIIAAATAILLFFITTTTIYITINSSISVIVGSSTNSSSSS